MDQSGKGAQWELPRGVGSPALPFDESRETDLQLSVDLALASEQPFLIYKLPLCTFTHSSRENSAALPKAFQVFFLQNLVVQPQPGDVRSHITIKIGKII